MTLRGIDVSSWQGEIDWPKAAVGLDFAIVRCVTETGVVDEKFERNVAAARAQGLVAGAYCFIDEDSEEAQAKLFVAACRNVGGPLILSPDWERGAGTVPTVTDFRAWTGIVRNAFPLQAMLVYGSAGVLAPKGDIAGWGPWWRAEYGPEPEPTGTWEQVYAARGGDSSPVWTDNALGWNRTTIWQFGRKGSVPGISGNVDLNATKLTQAELQRLAGRTVPVSVLEDAEHEIDRLTDLVGRQQAALEAAPSLEAHRIAGIVGAAEARRILEAAGYSE